MNTEKSAKSDPKKNLESPATNALSGICDSRRSTLKRGAIAAGSALLGTFNNFGLSASAAALSGTALANTPSISKGNSMYAYVGSRTTRERSARGDGISVFKMHPQNGSLEMVQLLTDLVNPSFLAFSANGKFLYTVHGDLSDISAFSVDQASGKLAFINRQSTKGKNPVHLAIDPTGRYVVVSNHLGSSLAVLPITEDGSLQEITQLVELTGPLGPHRIEQKLSKPHFNPFDPSGKFVIVADKGLDRIFTFRFENGRLTPSEPAFVVSREGAGPRHIAFHPNSRFAYVVNELDSSVTTYRCNASNGQLTPLQVLPTLPASFTGNSRASEIEASQDGRFLYVSNRGYDSVMTFSIDAGSGLLTTIEAQPTAGKTPRFFTIAPCGHFLYALNEDSDTIVTMRVNQTTGRLAPTGSSVKSGSPVCMVFTPQTI